jgi:hypothetical protein
MAADQRRSAVGDPAISQLADDDIYVGITAWAQLGQAKCGAFYPSAVSSAEERLRYYAAQYPITEVDSALLPGNRSDGRLVGGAHAAGVRVRREGVSSPHPPPDAT